MGKALKGQQQRGFAWDHYAPYFGQLAERDFVEPFVYHTHQLVSWNGIDEWIDSNEAQIDDFLDWSRDYQDWPWIPNPEQ